VAIGPPPLDTAKKSIVDYLETAQQQRPDLAAVRAQARQADAHVRSVRAQGLPSIYANVSVGSLFFENLTKGNPTHDLSVALTVPVFSGFSHHNDLLAAQAQADAAKAGVESFRDLIVLQVWTDFYNLERSERMVRTSDDLLASATQNQEVAAGRYKAGVGSVLDLLTAQAALESARAQQIQARAGWWVTAARLAFDTGRLSAGSPGPMQRTEPDQERKERNP
jgi:outer membrane protein